MDPGQREAILRLAWQEFGEAHLMVEFDSFEKAKAWRASPEYAEATKVRESCARSNVIVVEGVGAA